jgi:hexosaminidase
LALIGGWRTAPSGERTGGVYSAAEVREVVEYARRRGVMVVPEIEMPGHASAALAAYPQLGCTGAPVAVPASWGVFADVFCAGHEETFTFLQGVLDEVVALFPAPYVHVGGDEVPKDRWRACERCQALMRREGLADEEALQGWFLRRIAAHLAARGRTMIAWDEALAGGVPPGGMVQAWRDSAFTREAARRGHRTIASPNEWMYLNRSPGELTLADVYRFEPVPAGLDSAGRALVVGGEATFWSEHITSGTNLELMALPRLLAVAEVLWGSASRDLADLEGRIARDHASRLAAMGHVVGPADRPLPAVHVAYDTVARTARLRLTDAMPQTSVRLTRDGSRPTVRSRAIADGEALGGGAMLRLQAFVGAGSVREERQLRQHRHLAVGARATLTPAPSTTYPGTGAWTVTDGLLGGATHADGVWAGWWGPDAELRIDLGAPAVVDEMSLRALQDVRSWIVLPARVEFSWSNDGEQWTAPVPIAHAVPDSREGVVVHRFVQRLATPTRLRYVRAVVRNAGRLRAGHPGAGEPSWFFIDELVVSAPSAGAQR